MGVGRGELEVECEVWGKKATITVSATKPKLQLQKTPRTVLGPACCLTDASAVRWELGLDRTIIYGTVLLHREH